MDRLDQPSTGSRDGECGQGRTATSHSRSRSPDGAAGTQEMRHIKIDIGGRPSQRLFELGLVLARVVRGERSGELGIAAQIEYALTQRRIGDARASTRITSDLAREIAYTVYATELTHQAKPGRVDELIEACGAAAWSFGVGLEATFLLGLRHQQAEIYIGCSRRLSDTADDGWRGAEGRGGHGITGRSHGAPECSGSARLTENG